MVVGVPIFLYLGSKGKEVGRAGIWHTEKVVGLEMLRILYCLNPILLFCLLFLPLSLEFLHLLAFFSCMFLLKC